MYIFTSATTITTLRGDFCFLGYMIVPYEALYEPVEYVMSIVTSKV